MNVIFSFIHNICKIIDMEFLYRQVSNISRTESPNSNISRLGLQFSLRNILQPGVKPRMKM